MAEYLSFAKIGNIFAYYVNSLFEEDANLPITGLYAAMAVSLLVQIVLLARGLRNRDRDNLTTCLQEITALHNEVLENRLGQTTIVQQVEHKLDDKLGSVSNTLKTELSVTQDEIQHIYAMFETLETRLSEDNDELKNICSQLETQIGNVTQKLDTKVQDTQDRVEELDNAIQSIIEASKVADHKFESRFECLEDNLQYRTDRLHRSIRSIAEDSKSANHDLESRLQYLEGSFHGIQMLPKDDCIKDLEKHVNE
ncbi:Apolipoprotein/apolipophorin containing protein [Cricetulus griseus]|nr:Apolipoprotein/apolipophorin containing protein [Cricetulus griseus]